MLCTTVKKNMECVFMTQNGCSFNGGRCYPTVDKCNGCNHIVSFEGLEYCKTYADPSSKWLLGKCNYATNIVKEVVKESKQLDPIKASKRKVKGK